MIPAAHSEELQDFLRLCSTSRVYDAELWIRDWCLHPVTVQSCPNARQVVPRGGEQGSGGKLFRLSNTGFAEMIAELEPPRSLGRSRSRGPDADPDTYSAYAAAYIAMGRSKANSDWPLAANVLSSRPRRA